MLVPDTEGGIGLLLGPSDARDAPLCRGGCACGTGAGGAGAGLRLEARFPAEALLELVLTSCALPAEDLEAMLGDRARARGLSVEERLPGTRLVGVTTPRLREPAADNRGAARRDAEDGAGEEDRANDATEKAEVAPVDLPDVDTEEAGDTEADDELLPAVEDVALDPPLEEGLKPAAARTAQRISSGSFLYSALVRPQEAS